MSDAVKLVKFNPDYADKSMRIHADGLWMLVEEHYAALRESKAENAKLRDALFWFEVNSYDKRDAEKAGQFWREIIALKETKP